MSVDTHLQLDGTTPVDLTATINLYFHPEKGEERWDDPMAWVPYETIWGSQDDDPYDVPWGCSRVTVPAHLDRLRWATVFACDDFVDNRRNRVGDEQEFVESEFDKLKEARNIALVLLASAITSAEKLTGPSRPRPGEPD